MELTPTEYQEQKSLIEWASYQKCNYGSGKLIDYLIHIPNGGSRNPLEAKRLKDIGVKAGVSDLFLSLPNKKYCGLWIELKRRNGGKVTKSQGDWIDRMQDVGYRSAICHGWEEAKEVIEQYLKD